MNHEEMVELAMNEPDEFVDRYQLLSEMSDEALEKLQAAISDEQASRELPFYQQVMEDPIGYKERVTNPTPFDSDEDYKRHLNEQAANDPSFWDRQGDRCW